MKNYILAFIPLLLISCTDNSSDDTPNNQSANIEKISETLSVEELAVLPDIVNAQMEFVKSVILNDESGENIACSPISAQFVMSILANGTDADVQREIANALGCSDIETINELNKKISDVLPKQHSGTTFSSANSLWFDNSLSILNPFNETASKYYSLDSFSRNFADANLKSEINDWCASKTNNLIYDFLDENPNGMMALLNATYFKSPWVEKFETTNTKQLVFHGEDVTSYVPTMTKRVNNAFVNCTYPVSDSEAMSVKLLCGGNRFSVSFIMAAEGENLDQFILSDKFNHLSSEFFPSNVICYIPKFKLAPGKFSLLGTMRHLGIKNLFNNGTSGMFDQCVSITHIDQKVWLEINEDGAEAAATTKVDGDTAVAPDMAIHIDRPFVVLIRDESTGIILFAGKISNL